MPRRTKVRAKIVPLGVDIIDHRGDTLTGITERDAIDLYRSLCALLPRIKDRAMLAAKPSPPNRRTNP